MNQVYPRGFVTVSRGWVSLVMALLWVGTAPSAAAGTAGSLDLTFNGTGKVLTDFGSGRGESAHAVAIQSDGKIVVAGSNTTFTGVTDDFALARYNPDGTLDPSFGTGGKVRTDFGGSEVAAALAIQSDGRIVVAGSSMIGLTTPVGDFALARYNPDGTLDNSFGTGGKVLTDFGSGFPGEHGSGLAIQSDGKIVVAGDATGPRIALARYNADGSLDSSFGTGGKVLDASDDIWTAGLAIQSDSKIVIAGMVGVGDSDFLLARYNADGSPDDSFGAAGKVFTDFGNGDGATAVVIQSDSKIVAAGVSDNNFALARYNTDGSLDISFGTAGKVLTDFGGDDAAHGLAIQSDGKIVAAGVSILSFWQAADFALARYNTDGSLDGTFGTAGKVLTDFGGWDHSRAVAIQSDGKIVVAGGSREAGDGVGDSSDFAVARYLPDAANLISDLIGMVESFNLPAGIETSLIAKLAEALAAVDAGNNAVACTALTDFISQVTAQSGKKKLTVTQANQLIAAAQELRVY